jgi:hypothetical protein
MTMEIPVKDDKTAESIEPFVVAEGLMGCLGSCAGSSRADLMFTCQTS